jgi:hypothetical protein
MIAATSTERQRRIGADGTDDSSDRAPSTAHPDDRTILSPASQ